MKIVVVGNGKVGYSLSSSLAKEGHDIVVIDNDSAVLQSSQENIDVAVVEGNGATVDAQREAGVATSDLLIAATNSDEVNLLCCIVARKLGCKNTVARVRNPEYDQQLEFLTRELGLSFAINPEKATAREIYRLLRFPSFLKRDSFAQGLVELVELRLAPDNILVDKQLNRLGSVIKNKALVCVVERAGEVVIPDGSFRLAADDRITLAAEASQLVELLSEMNISNIKARHVILVGGSRIAEYLAIRLIRSKVKVTIIEQNPERCSQLADLLPQAMVICGNGSQEQVLREEGISSADAVVTLTGSDEENLIISLLSSHLGVPKTITKISRTEYAPLFTENSALDTLICPKQLTATEIIRYVRAIGASEASASIDTLYRLADDKVEALGFTAPADATYIGKTFAELKLKSNTLVASIIRDRQIIIPKGSDYILPGDKVVVVCPASRGVAELDEIIR